MLKRQLATTIILLSFNTILFLLLQMPVFTSAFGIVSEVTDINFFQTIGQTKNVLIEFWQSGCPYCEVMVYPFYQLSNDYGDKITFARLNIVDHPNIAEYYQIESTPTYLLFENGYPTQKIEGASEDALISLLENLESYPTIEENWNLEVNIINVPSHIDRITISVIGAFDEMTSMDINVPAFSNSLSTNFQIPIDKVPSGHNFKVCASEYGDSDDYCEEYTYTDDGFDNYVTIDWSDIQTSTFNSNDNGSACPSFLPSALKISFQDSPSRFTPCPSAPDIPGPFD